MDEIPRAKINLVCINVGFFIVFCVDLTLLLGLFFIHAIFFFSSGYLVRCGVWQEALPPVLPRLIQREADPRDPAGPLLLRHQTFLSLNDLPR